MFLSDDDRIGSSVLLIRRGGEPFRDFWALPGGFLEEDETLEAAAVRELGEETGVAAVPLRQIGAFSDPHRDPRTRVISFAFGGVLDAPPPNLRAASDAAGAGWFPLERLPRLAFDHREIIDAARGVLGVA